MAERSESGRSWAERDEARRRLVIENETQARAFNEVVVDSSPDGDGPDATVLISCECGDATCHERLRVARREYDAVRTNPRRFLIRRGHAIPRFERIVGNVLDVEVVEKR